MQVAVTAGQDTATYSSAALRQLVAAAVEANRRVPPQLGGYRAELESEVSVAARRADGSETVFSTEQIASTLTWNRTGATAQEIVGYRSHAASMQVSLLGAFTTAFAVPALYGNRLSMMFGGDTGSRARAPGLDESQRQENVAIHPLATDREAFYRFTGGDTITTLRVNDRVIRIARVLVSPRPGLKGKVTTFDGEVDIDADRMVVVRMRGRFTSTGGSSSLLAKIMAQAVDAATYVELEDSEHTGAYWLPNYQRFEIQARTPIFGDARLIVRVVTRFKEYEDYPPATALVPESDSLRASRHTLTVAGMDTLRQYAHWKRNLGELSSDVRASDFDDVSPPRFRPSGEPLVRFQAERFSDLLHFNRVEGFYTGFGLVAKLRNALPGLTLRMNAGYAWSERTVRGRISAELARGKTSWSVRAGRILDNTNDFRSPFDSGSTLGALSGRDDFDYVDRSGVFASVTNPVPGFPAFAFRLEGAYVRDGQVEAHLDRGLIGRKLDFIADRGVREGRYLRSALQLQLNPDLDAAMARVGTSVVLRYERGDGELDYQRMTLRLAQRLNRGMWTFAYSADAGVLLGPTVIPQQLFEIGRSENLEPYAFKEFAGNHAALARGIVMRRLPIFQAPIRITRQIWLPEPSPALAVTVQSGWSELSTAAARAAEVQASRGLLPVATGTGSARTTIGAGIRFFGGAAGIMAVRAVDHAGKWSVRVDLRPQP